MELLRQRRRMQLRSRESGSVLLIALIILIIITAATLSVVRSMDIGNVISGNFAFKQAAMQVSDRGITDATNNLAAIVAGGGGNADQANRYFSTRRNDVDSLGVPSAVNWSNVQCRDEDNNDCDADKDTGKYRVQYVIERQCSDNPVLSDPQSVKTNCDYEVREASPEQLAVRYRIIVRVRGPRNATGMVEAMVSGPVSS
ncbi:hypothetical protein [Noviherbaspirillum sp.]|uniref:hypothetical protein n=1 Tax=Noviherbaspirillum sp. TaxID=1926288 RepID=UPI002D7808E2|nr:hypothetical protein [Noviherbaspirillum sp.]